MVVLETCTGGGFSTISLAGHAKHVYTVEIDKARMEAAKKNAEIASLEDKVNLLMEIYYQKKRRLCCLL
jgi:predicted O-methyltransferase YrrM